MTTEINLLTAVLYGSSKYVDLSDIDNPIKEYVSILNTWKFHPEIAFNSNIYIERQEVILEDSLFMKFREPEPIKFNKLPDLVGVRNDQAIRINDYNQPFYNPYNLAIQLSPDKHQYRRSLFNFLEMTGILGGIFEVFELSVTLVLGVFYTTMAKRSLVNEIRKNVAQLENTKAELEKLKVIIKQQNAPNRD